MAAESPVAGAVRELEFRFPEADRDVLRGATVQVNVGRRLLLTGQNGAGKTTLLRVWAGKNLVTRGAASVWSPSRDKMVNAFDAVGSDGVRYLGGVWAQRLEGGRYGTPFEGDIEVKQLLTADVGVEATRAAGEVVQAFTRATAEGTPVVLEGIGDAFSQRIGSLLFTLDIDLRWRLHRVSDGQRRRVQILMALIHPFKLLFLDEVTVDLDVLVRRDLLRWLKNECEETGASIVYATHIFDGLGEWVTDVAHLCRGVITRQGSLESFAPEMAQLSSDRTVSSNSSLLELVEGWLTEDKKLAAAEDAASSAPHARDGVAAAPDEIIHMPTAHGGNRFYNYWG
jgi:CCR4-NOT complex subunit CAF16